MSGTEQTLHSVFRKIDALLKIHQPKFKPGLQKQAFKKFFFGFLGFQVSNGFFDIKTEHEIKYDPKPHDRHPIYTYLTEDKSPVSEE